MATTKYVNTSNMDSSTINLGNFTADISAHGEEVVFVNALPKLVNLICRPVWIIIGTIGEWFYFAYHTTLFSKRSAHENHPNFLRSLGHWPWPWVILILSNGLESNLQKTLCQDHLTKLALPGVGVTGRTVYILWVSRTTSRITESYLMNFL